MGHIRSLAKELRRLEKKKQAAATPPPPQAPTEAAEAAETRHADPAAPLSPAQGAALAPAGPHSSPPSAAPSFSDHSDDARSSSSRSSSAAPSDSHPRRRKKDATDLFALGGSRFDILLNGSYGDGAACRKSDVRKATKVCSSGKDALQRSDDDLMAVDSNSRPETYAAAAAAGATANAGGAAGACSPPLPPAPPLGTSCGIPSRAPFKRLLPQPFSHLLVCDFEATCASGSVHYPHEIIEFPVVVLDAATLRIVAEFHRYVRPVRNPKLTPFCTELTGITQAMVDSAEPLPVVVAEFQAWLEESVYPLCAQWAAHYGSGKLSHNLRAEQKRFVLDDRTEAAAANAPYEAMICMATDGPWDMRRFMHECSVLRDGIDFPPLCYRYINVRHCYSDHFKCRQVKLTHMLKKMSMSFEGRRHSGIDDTRNIARVLAELMARGYRVHHVSTIKYAHRGDAFLASNKAAQELMAEFGEQDKTHTTRHANAGANSGGGSGSNHQNVSGGKSAHKHAAKRGGGKK